jgi:hypothetical protein
MHDFLTEIKKSPINAKQCLVAVILSKFAGGGVLSNNK